MPSKKPSPDRYQIGPRTVVVLPEGLTLGVHQGDSLKDATPAAARAFVGDTFDSALASQQLRRRDIAAIDAIPATARGERALTAPRPPVRIEVAHDADEGAVVQVEHEDGGISWYVATNPASAGTQHFEIPAADLEALPAAGTRGLFGIGKKLLKVFTFPLDLVEKGVGKVAAGFVRKWEKSHRPYLIRTYGVGDYQAPAGPLTAADWARLSEGRALLFVHGTFSSCDAFKSIDRETMQLLSDRYQGRLFAFNHPTMGDDPGDNARYFIESIPDTIGRLDVDIVCHSRGGLVSRAIANAGRDARRLTVKRIVFVGATNNGTLLADKDHVLSMVNRYSTIAKMVPSSVLDAIVEGVVVVLKVAAQALLEEMRGLKAMDPRGKYLEGINRIPTAAEQLYAIASNFEPPPGSPLLSVTRAADAAIDDIFEHAENDLVVPTLGVYEAPNAPGFPIRDRRRFEKADAVMHTHFFEQPRTWQYLAEWLEPSTTRELAFARGGQLTGDELQSVRPHVVNLHDGAFSTRGRYTTSPADVDAIVARAIPEFAKKLRPNEPLRIVFWAHGGTINEQEGLAIAQKHIYWWLDNGVYPIYFAWESGLFDALGSMLSHREAPGARGFTEWTDRAVEGLVRTLRGDAVWSAMKSSAQRASAADGGARYVLSKFAKLPATIEGHRVELHAVGHSAGSVFHAHFARAAKELSVPAFRTMQFLAPAIRVDEFKTMLEPLLGSQVNQLTMFSMSNDREIRDNCFGVYRKSLLYLIYHALERRDREPLLGMQICVDNEPSLRALFSGSQHAAFWSVTNPATGPDATASTTHGGFDDDPATMTSVAGRVLGGPARVPYRGDARKDRSWPIAPELRSLISLPSGESESSAGSEFAAAPSSSAAPPARPPMDGRRIALCIGIDDYPDPNRLSGCVNDARKWSATLTQLGFTDLTRLENREATRDRILSELKRVVQQARPGDSVVFQYAGHGTSLVDDDGDEDDNRDEALVPIDFADGQFITDDDLRDIVSRVADGVSLTCFMDCCHSGTNTRVFGPTAGPGRGKARFMTIAPDSDVAHKDFARRQRERGTGQMRAVVDRTVMKWISFAACQDSEKAMETNGNGVFTRAATEILAQGLAGLTNGEFERRVLEVLGAERTQNPRLDCAGGSETLPLLQFGGVTGRATQFVDRRLASRRAPDSPLYDPYGRRGVPRRSENVARYEAEKDAHVKALREAADYFEKPQ